MILFIEIHEVFSKERISASTGAYFARIDNKHIYQKTLPILYYFNLSLELDIENLQQIILGFQHNQISKYTRKTDILRLYENIHNLKELESMNLAVMRSFETKKPSRTKRGLQFLGDTLAWCCNTLTTREGQSFIRNENSLKDAYDKLKEVVLQSHVELLNVSTEMHDFAHKVQTSFSKLKEDVMYIGRSLEAINNEVEYESNYTAIFQAIQAHYATAVTLNVKLSYLHNSCKSHNIPSAIISASTLRRDLKKLNIAAKKNNLELAIDEYDYDLYYHAKLTSCVVIDNRVEIEIKIPLKQNGTDFSLYRFVPISFKSHDNQLCAWEQETALIIYESTKKSIYLVTGTELDLCDTKEHICQTPNERSASNKIACASALFGEVEFKQLLMSCALKCEENHGTTITTQIDHDRFAVTNIQSTLIASNQVNYTSHKIKTESEWPGMTILTVPCEYQIEQKTRFGTNEIIIPAGIPCIADKYNSIKIEHYLPLLWTNLEDVEIDSGFHQTFRFSNMTSAYNKNWTNLVPIFSTLSPTKELRKRLKEVELQIPQLNENQTWNLIHVILILWCGILTSLFLLVIFLSLKSQILHKTVNSEFTNMMDNIMSRHVDNVRETTL